MKRLENGFTLIEVVIVLGLSAFFVTLIMFFGISYWRYSSLLEADLDTFVNRLNAQDYIREMVGTTDGLITQNSIPDAHVGNSDPIAGASYWIPIHAVPGNVSSGSSGTTPLLYFRRMTITTSNTIAMNGLQPYDDEYVLYLNGATKQLFVRTLANPDVLNNKAITSCPPSLATASCPADKMLLDKLDSVDTVYYSRSGNTINHQSITDPDTGAYIGPDFQLVEALQYTFHIKGKPLFQTSTATVNDTIVRIALRNT